MNNPTKLETAIIHELNVHVIELNRLMTLERDFIVLNRLCETAYSIRVLLRIITRSDVEIPNIDTILQSLIKFNFYLYTFKQKKQ
jgi:hypothetical protein